jgi:hypothetical protein
LKSVGWVEQFLSDVPVLQCTSETQQLGHVFARRRQPPKQSPARRGGDCFAHFVHSQRHIDKSRLG